MSEAENPILKGEITAIQKQGDNKICAIIQFNYPTDSTEPRKPSAEMLSKCTMQESEWHHKKYEEALERYRGDMEKLKHLSIGKYTIQKRPRILNRFFIITTLGILFASRVF